MARYPSTSYGRRRRRIRIWLYTGVALLIIAVVIVCIYVYRSSGNNTGGTGPGSKGTLPPGIGLPPEPNLSKPPQEPPIKPNPEAAKLIAQATECINAKPARIIDAREILNDALAMPMNAQQRAIVKKQLSILKSSI